MSLFGYACGGIVAYSPIPPSSDAYVLHVEDFALYFLALSLSSCARHLLHYSGDDWMDGMHMDRKVGLEDGKWLMDGQLFNSCVFRKMFCLDKEKTIKSVGSSKA